MEFEEHILYLKILKIKVRNENLRTNGFQFINHSHGKMEID